MPILSKDDPSAVHFVYPPDLYNNKANLSFNSIDTVNASWSGANAHNYTTQLSFYIIPNGEKERVVWQSVVPSTGFKEFELNNVSNYPASGHFELSYILPNGSFEGDSNSVAFGLFQNEDLKPVTWSANVSSAFQTSQAVTIPQASSSSGLSSAGIGAAVVGVLVALLVLTAAGFVLLRRRKAQLLASQKDMKTVENQGSISGQSSSSMHYHKAESPVGVSKGDTSQAEMSACRSPVNFDPTPSAWTISQNNIPLQPQELPSEDRWALKSNNPFISVGTSEV